jgi:anti-sigma regulatory factor (Ser/Thr protein kinase)
MYKTETVTSMSDQDNIAVTVETAYTVADKTADGYVIDIKTTSVSNNADANNTMGRILAISSEMMKDVTVRIATDKNGQLTKVLNYDEVKNKIQAAAKSW